MARSTTTSRTPVRNLCGIARALASAAFMLTAAVHGARAQPTPRQPSSSPPAQAAEPAAEAVEPSRAAESPAPAESQTPAVQNSARAEAAARSRQQHAAQLLMSLEELSRIGSLTQSVGSIAGIVVGGLTVAYGVSVAVAGDELGQTSGRAALSGLALSGGAVVIARGIHALVAVDNRDQQRFQRLQALEAEGRADAATLARFEGEFAAEADSARAARIAAGFSSLAVAAGGGALIAFGASPELQGNAQSAAFVFGGSLLGLGLLQSVASFLVASPHERAWDRYRGMRGAADSSLIRVGVVPILGPKAVALGVHASF